MPRSAIQGAQKLARQLGAIIAGQAEQALFQKIALGTQNFAGAAASLDASFTFTPRFNNSHDSGSVLLQAVYCVQCSAGDVEITGTILHGATPFSEAVSMDSGGSADHNATGSLMVVDAAIDEFVPITYHVHAAAASGTITAAVGKGYLTLFAWQMPDGVSLAFS